MNRRALEPLARPAPRWRGQSGVTIIEVLVALTLTVVLTGSMYILVGAAIRSKLITAVRSADTDTARQALEWMSERLRNAGLNLVPAEQSLPRCKDMVVAQEAALLPTGSALHVNGEIINTDGVAGNEVATIGYRLGSDPGTGNQVVQEFIQPCTAGAPSTLTTLSDPRLSVTALTFAYFDANGATVTALTDMTQIRRIRGIRLSLTVVGSQGRSGIQTQTLATYLLLRNPEPNASGWKNADENF